VKSLIAALLLLGLYIGPAQAAKEYDPGKVLYLELRPSLVGNYGDGPRPRFYKADVALRVTGTFAMARLEHHQPLIRNELIMLFAAVPTGGMDSLEAKEQLRQKALERIRAAIEYEEGYPLVEDLLFTNLIAQP
jgi:flagellar FliL protein